VPLFSGYDDHYLKIGDERYSEGLMIHRDTIHAPWGPARLQQLTLEQLGEILTTPPEVVILGTGRVTAFPDMRILEACSQLHLGIECMDTRAAARTYNILVTEGREVSAAMLPPSA